MTTVLSHIINGIASAFERVNDMPDPDQRAALFATEADRIVDAEISKITPAD